MNKEDIYNLYSRPMTNKQFTKLYNFNNPQVEDYWTKALDHVEEYCSNDFPISDSDFAIKSKNESLKEIGEHKIKICYL